MHLAYVVRCELLFVCDVKFETDAVSIQCKALAFILLLETLIIKQRKRWCLQLPAIECKNRLDIDCG